MSAHVDASCRVRCIPLRFGMNVFDTYDQLLGRIVLARDGYFVMRQELGVNQFVAVPIVAISGIAGDFVFLTLTPGEIELFCKTLERRVRGPAGCGLLPRLVQPGTIVNQH